MAIRLHLFGTPGIANANNQIQPLRRAKGVGVLAYLLLEPEQQHNRSVLASMLWGESDEAHSRRNLSQALKRIKDELATAAGQTPASVIVSTRSALGIAEGSIECDAVQFDRLLQETEAHKHSALQSCFHCQTLLRKAVTLVKGQLLEGLDAGAGAELFEEWLLLKRESIHEHLMAALALLADVTIAGAAFDDAAQFARQQLAAEPWRESAHRQLIEALIGKEDMTGALVQFGNCKTVLWEQLAIEPSEETVALIKGSAHQVESKTGDAGSTAQLNPEGLESVDASAEAIPKNNLPSALMPMFGRESDLEDLFQQVLSPESRIITIMGPGGIGKTTLALETGRELLKVEDSGLDGIYFVPLVGVDSAEMVPDAIANAVGLSINKSETAADSVSTFFTDKVALLILDNFEHLLDATNWLIQLIEQAPRLQLLVTSREQLGLMSEAIYPVDGLCTPPLLADMKEANRFAATRLFIDRAKRQHQQFRLSDENWPSIRALCKQLGGHPLAIELTTTLLADMTLPEIVESVNESVVDLETDLRDIAPHHRSMQAVFEQSWRRIDSREQQVIAALSVMRGPFSSQAAKAVADAMPISLRRLRHNSFLRSTAPGRYDMHELVRQFSAEKLAQTPSQVEESQRRLARYYLGRIAAITDHLDQADGIPYIEAFEQNLDTIRRAWQYAIAFADLPIIRNALLGMAHFMQRIGRYTELLALFESIDAMLSQQSDSIDKAWIGAGTQTVTAAIYSITRHKALSEEAMVTALRAAESLDIAEMVAWNRLTELNNFVFVGDHESVAERVDDLIAYCRQHSLVSLQARTLFEGGFSAYFISNYDRAERYFQGVLDLFDSTGQGIGQASRAVGYLGVIKLDEAKYEDARDNLLLSLDRAELSQDRRWASFSNHFLGLLNILLGQYERVVEVEVRALETMRAIGDVDAQSFMLHTLSCAQRHLGLIEQSKVSANQALSFGRETGTLLTQSYALDQCSELAALDGEWETAMAYIREAAQLMAQSGRERESRLFYFIEARMLLDSGDGVGSAEMLEPLLQYLPTEGTPYRDSPVFGPLRAFAMADRIMENSTDPRREYYLNIAQSYLYTIADKITDQTLRHSFLNNDPENRHLVDAVKNFSAQIEATY